MALHDTVWESRNVVAFGGGILILLIYLLWHLLSPISRIPGPLLTKFSYIPEFYHDYYSNRTSWVDGLHKKYGPVVRLAPNEISFASATGIRDIFSGSPKTGGAFPKSKYFELFKHFGARNCFTSISAEQHGWRRRIIGANYTQSAVLGREAATGNIWKIVRDYFSYIAHEGKATRKSDARAIDLHMANTFFAGDGVSSFVFLTGTRALAGDPRDRRLIHNTQEKPEDLLTYIRQEYRSYFNTLEAAKQNLKQLFVPGKGPQILSERTRVGDKDPSKLNSRWYGGTEMRDYGFRRYMIARGAVEDGMAEVLKGPTASKLALHVIAGDALEKKEKPATEDLGMRGFYRDGGVDNYLKDAGAASEIMDHLVAGQDTTSETLSHAIQSLSMPHNSAIQDRLRDEVLALELPTSNDSPLSLELLNRIMSAPYLDAIVKETLRLYPPHTTPIHRVVPPGGRVVDGHYLPEAIKVGTSAYVTNHDESAFGDNINSWVPERWLSKDPARAREMEHTLWSFGSGSRGCIGKHLANVEMKLLLSAMYGRYMTYLDYETDVPVVVDHFHHRTTNRDITYFPAANGVIAFKKL